MYHPYRSYTRLQKFDAFLILQCGKRLEPVTFDAFNNVYNPRNWIGQVTRAIQLGQAARKFNLASMAMPKANDILSHSQPVGKKNRFREWSAVWAWIVYEDRQPRDTTQQVCKKGYKSLHCKTGSTSNLDKHLAERHSDLCKELKSHAILKWLLKSFVEDLNVSESGIN